MSCTTGRAPNLECSHFTQINTIRVYNVNPETNHDDCASIFNAAGIYMILDVNGPSGGESLNREAPESSYHEGYLERIFGVVENFMGYPNTLGFFGGNEVINEDSVKTVPEYLRVRFLSPSPFAIAMAYTRG